MHNSPSYADCVPDAGTWKETRSGRYPQYLLVLLAILTAAAAGGVAIWYFLNSWISIPLL
jgi:hypothetical protein